MATWKQRKRICTGVDLKSKIAKINWYSENVQMNGEPSSEESKVSEVAFSNSGVRDPLVDTTLDGRFVIEEILGRGGMSVVYKARQLRVNRHVAIKTLRMQAEAKPIYKERFEREISSLCSLNHPNIVTVYDCIVGPDDQPYVVMDYLRGRSLEELIKSEGPLVVGRFASIAMQICSALDHAHKKGIVHRDLKPGNIVMIDNETDFVKVVDFGLAKLSIDNRNLTQSGELWGSPPYMSPEQCMGESGDERSDIYSLGAVMYEMIAGKDPFSDAHSVFEFIQRHIHASPPPFFQSNPKVSIPLELESLIFKALEKSPLDRFQTAQELQDAIVQACGEESGKLIYHPSRAGRGTNGTGIEVGAPRTDSLDNLKARNERSDKSQQVAWFAGMLGAGTLDESSTIEQIATEETTPRVDDDVLIAPPLVTQVPVDGQSLTAQESAAALRQESDQVFAETNSLLIKSEPTATKPVAVELLASESAPPPPVAPLVPLNSTLDSKRHSFAEELPVVPTVEEIEVSPSNSRQNVWMFLILVTLLLVSLACMTVCMQPKTPEPRAVKNTVEETEVRQHRRPTIPRTPSETEPMPDEPNNQTSDIEIE